MDSIVRLIKRGSLLLALLALCPAVALSTASAEDTAESMEEMELPPWSVYGGGGYVFFERDQENYGGQYYQAKVGYKFAPRWTIEWDLGIFPFVEGRDFEGQNIAGGKSTVGENWGLQSGAAILFHFIKRPEKWDPFLSFNGGLTWWKKKLNTGFWHPNGGLGVGTNYFFNNNWSLRGEAVTLVTGEHTEFNQYLMAYLGYHWGGKKKKAAEGEGLFAEHKPVPALGTVYYDFDSSTLREDTKETLQNNAEWLKKEENASKKVVIEGHCDERGTQEYNYALGERRAQSAYDYYRALGVPEEQMSTLSLGEDNPADPGHNEEAWAKNRRAETKVVDE